MEQYLKINDTRIHIECTGEGETVLLLAGLGSLSPITEFRPLVEQLKDSCRVVVLEYAGYGQSDDASSPRTIEHITEEIHEVMRQLGEQRYTLIAHSLAGIYGLHYVNRFREEVKAFIGIDISVPQQFSGELARQEANSILQAQQENLHNESEEFYKETQEAAIAFLAGQTTYPYSSEDLAHYARMAWRAAHRTTVIDEIRHLDENAKKVAPLRFPKECRTLLLLSAENIKRLPEWEQWHRELIDDSSLAEIITGDHYLHLQSTETVANRIREFLK